MNILFANYADFSSNSLNHIAPFANYLCERGYHCIVVVPANTQSRAILEKVLFQTTTYSDVLNLQCHFPNGRPADILHAWTPRINVANFVSCYFARYGQSAKLVVHLEDNEEALIESYYKQPLTDLSSLTVPVGYDQWQPMLSHPTQYRDLLERADAYTVVLDTLFDFLPNSGARIELLPSVECNSPTADRSTMRTRLGLASAEPIIVYPGGVSSNNIDDIADLFKAVKRLREDGVPARLIKTGPNNRALLEACGFDPSPFLVDLGMVPKQQLYQILHVADLLVQPGSSDVFNDYRLPSKLPEFLAAGKPVITGQTNLGKRLKHGQEAYLLSSTSAENIARACKEILATPSLAQALCEGGRSFCHRHFDPQKNGERLLNFYEEQLSTPPIPSTAARKRLSGPKTNLQVYRDLKESPNWFDIKGLRRRLNIFLASNEPLLRTPRERASFPEVEASERQSQESCNDYGQFYRKLKPKIELYCHAFETRWKRLNNQPTLSLILPVYKSNIRLLHEAIESVRKQVYPNWQLCIVDDYSNDQKLAAFLREVDSSDSRIVATSRKSNGHISLASNAALQFAKGDYVAFLDHDDLLAPHALARIIDIVNEDPEAAIIYTDEDKINESGERESPYFKPDWDPMLIVCQNYIGHLCVYKNSLIRSIGGFQTGFEGAQDWDLLLRASKRCDPRTIRHIPEVLYHWRATDSSTALDPKNKEYAHAAARKALFRHISNAGYDGEIESHRGIYFKPRYKIQFRPRTTLIPENHPNAAGATIYQREIGFHDSDLRILPPFKSNAIPSAGEIGQARNDAISRAASEMICIARTDLSPISVDWLDQLLAHATQISIGVASAKIVQEGNRVFHSGFVKKEDQLWLTAFAGIDANDDGYFHRCLLNSSFSAVSSQCILFRKAVWEEVGGFSEILSDVNSIDVDFCQRVVEKCFRVVLVPDALLKKRTTKLTSPVAPIEARRANPSPDPQYNPNLTFKSGNFSLNMERETDYPCE